MYFKQLGGCRINTQFRLRGQALKQETTPFGINVHLLHRLRKSVRPVDTRKTQKTYLYEEP